MTGYALDTNVLVRFLTQDDAKQATRAETFLKKHCSKEQPGFINRIVLCELVWVLERGYRYSRGQIVATLEKLLRTQQLRIENASAAWQALALYETTKVDFADALIGVLNHEQGYEKTVSFDHTAFTALVYFESL